MLYPFLVGCISLFTLHTNKAHERIMAEISYGELVDKITILEIKSERISDEKKRENIYAELEILMRIFEQYIGNRSDVIQLKKRLKTTNTHLWDVEDAIRVKERNKIFDDEFIALARSVYHINDERTKLKHTINILMKSYIFEEKLYEQY